MVIAGTRLWFTWQTIGGDFDVLLAPQSVFKLWDAADSEGLTVASEGFILLDETLGYRRLVAVLVHELLHAVLSTPAEANLLARLFGCDVADATAREEEIVTLLGPKLADALARNRLLDLPPLPSEAS